jgi:hypothetical protein
VSRLSDEEIIQAIGKIVEPFQRLECFECAQAVLGWLRCNQVQGRLLRLRTKYRDEFIVSQRWERGGGAESVSINGIHYGVEVVGLVFDNLAGEGLPREEWVKDFDCRRGAFVVEVLEQV